MSSFDMRCRGSLFKKSLAAACGGLPRSATVMLRHEDFRLGDVPPLPAMDSWHVTTTGDRRGHSGAERRKDSHDMFRGRRTFDDNIETMIEGR